MRYDAGTISVSDSSHAEELTKVNRTFVPDAPGTAGKEVLASLFLFRDSVKPGDDFVVRRASIILDIKRPDPATNIKHKSEAPFSQTSNRMPSTDRSVSKGLFGRNRRNNG